MSRLARRVLAWAGVRDVRAGLTRPPGALRAVRLAQPDGTELSAVSLGDEVDLYLAQGAAVTRVTAHRAAALRLAWWLLWAVWARGTWCGLKTAVWRWALARVITERP